MKKSGNYVRKTENSVYVAASSSCVGKYESEGPLGAYFDICFPDDGIKSETWEKAEAKLIDSAVDTVLNKSGFSSDDIDIAFAGDLLNQCTASTYGLRKYGIPYCGLFGACSTMAQSLALATVCVDSGSVANALCVTSSHFCSAEKQFRYPLEYGAQRCPSAQRTVTGSGAFILSSDKKSNVSLDKIMFGCITDLGITDSSNMGAVMAPAAAKSISCFLDETETTPEDYDFILTGDLGKVGSDILLDHIYTRYRKDISKVHNDCGLLIFDSDKQDVHSGGSGCGCSAVVMASLIMNKMSKGEIRRILFAGTGALMSPLVCLQGESIPGICHIAEFCYKEV